MGRRTTVRDVAKAGKVSPSWIYYWYGNIDTLYRLAIKSRVSQLASVLNWSSAHDGTVRATVQDFAQVCAQLFASDRYRRLLYLVVRDGPHNPWLIKAHQELILDKAKATLASTVSKAGALSGLCLDIRASAAHAFVTRFQNDLALPMLLPKKKEPTTAEIRRLVQINVDQAMGGIYCIGTTLMLMERASPRRSCAGKERNGQEMAGGWQQRSI